MVSEINRSNTSFTDSGPRDGAYGGALNATQISRARPDARFMADPGVIIKSTGSRIEAGFGAQIIAEGTADRPVVFTSKYDDTYGAGGTLDTNNDGSAAKPAAGDWGGLVVRHLGSGSIDHAVIAYGGGLTSVPGGFAGFNAIEFHRSHRARCQFAAVSQRRRCRRQSR
ncbi:MAG: hypothetical protein U0892_01845 [Pirellulales bacterium]